MGNLVAYGAYVPSWRLQLRGEAGDRQVDNGRTLGLTHNLRGQPSIVGRERGDPR
jgi:hypothetical protein